MLRAGPSASLDRLEAVLESLAASTKASANFLWISLDYYLVLLIMKINGMQWTFQYQFVAIPIRYGSFPMLLTMLRSERPVNGTHAIGSFLAGSILISRADVTSSGSIKASYQSIMQTMRFKS